MLKCHFLGYMDKKASIKEQKKVRKKDKTGRKMRGRT